MHSGAGTIVLVKDITIAMKAIYLTFQSSFNATEYITHETEYPMFLSILSNYFYQLIVYLQCIPVLLLPQDNGHVLCHPSYSRESDNHLTMQPCSIVTRSGSNAWTCLLFWLIEAMANNNEGRKDYLHTLLGLFNMQIVVDIGFKLWEWRQKNFPSHFIDSTQMQAEIFFYPIK